MTSISCRLHTLQQGVAITGAGLPQFQTAANAVAAIHSIFSHSLPDYHLDPYPPSFFNDFPTIHATSRYFSPMKDITGGSLHFPHSVDPNGILKSLESHELVHASDNVVLYFKSNDNMYAFNS
jgi:hypothetical protein